MPQLRRTRRDDRPRPADLAIASRFGLINEASPTLDADQLAEHGTGTAVEATVSVSDLDSAFGTEAIGRGHDIRTVAGRLGHANPAMTLRPNAHAIDGADAGNAAALAESLDGET